MERREGWLVVGVALARELSRTPYPIEKIKELMRFRGMEEYHDEMRRCTLYRGECELFEWLNENEDAPSYDIRVDLTEPEPIIEVLKRRGKHGF
jgi:hypothetical protein